MTYKERLIELLQHSPTDAMGNHGVGAMADHLMDNGLVFKELYEDMEERIAHQRVRAQTAEHFICKLCAECDYEDNNGITTMILKCCSMFPECGKFKLRSGWIPVSEPPKERECYFVTVKHWLDGKPVTREAYWNGADWLSCDKRHELTPRVTHWMPLPTPQQEEI